MTRDFVADIKEFHEKFGLEYQGKPRLLIEEMKKFRLLFLKEELLEYERAFSGVDFADYADVTHCLEHALDSLVDLVYVAIGTAYLHGFDFREAWRRVHEANMKKERAVHIADSKRGSMFDVVKPKGWEPPSHKDLVEGHSHRSDLP